MASTSSGSTNFTGTFASPSSGVWATGTTNVNLDPPQKRKIRLICSKCKKLIAEYYGSEFMFPIDTSGNMSMNNTDTEALCPLCYKLEKLKE